MPCILESVVLAFLLLVRFNLPFLTRKMSNYEAGNHLAQMSIGSSGSYGWSLQCAERRSWLKSSVRIRRWSRKTTKIVGDRYIEWRNVQPNVQSGPQLTVPR
jgi:hypothetical protein